jgi:hypothetical protein
MRFVKQSKKKSPKITVILLDWSVRESFHICHYLKNQYTPQEDFEVIFVEYYGCVSQAALQFEDRIDTWVLLEMPSESCYHKHLMYNIGFMLSHGEIIVICDSDAMVKPTFIQSILFAFQNNPNLVLHLDQFRNSRRDFYPFNYPTFDEVIGKGCINYKNGVPTGIASYEDVLHLRNYGACFSCRRTDYIAIGGADEHVDYVGHICGPYDMTFRLCNFGRKEIWHSHEFLYHTWHPGTDGENNYLGPHDGLNLSTTSLEALVTRRTQPHVVNPIISSMQKGVFPTQQEILTKSITEENYKNTIHAFLKTRKAVKKVRNSTYHGIEIGTKQFLKIGSRFDRVLFKARSAIYVIKLLTVGFGKMLLKKKNGFREEAKNEKNTNENSMHVIWFIRNLSRCFVMRMQHITVWILPTLRRVLQEANYMNVLISAEPLWWHIVCKNYKRDNRKTIFINDRSTYFIVDQLLIMKKRTLFSINESVQMLTLVLCPTERISLCRDTFYFAKSSSRMFRNCSFHFCIENFSSTDFRAFI